MTTPKIEHKIKHLVIAGGGPTGIISLGALQYLETNKFFNIEDIETIYATSVGAILATLMSMRFEWSMITDYIIKRPWHEAMKITPGMIFDAYSKKGIFDRDFVEIIFKPFFIIKEWSLDITMSEFYEITKKELHFFSLEVDNFTIKDISYKTFPDLPILTAIQMTSAVPGIIAPVFFDERCYIDGGLLCNYPLKNCIDDVEKSDEIFAINNFYVKSSNNIIKHNSTILEFIMNLITNMIFSVGSQFLTKPNCIKNELLFETHTMTFEDLHNTIYDKNYREKLYDSGFEGAKVYLKKKTEETTVSISENECEDKDLKNSV